MSDKKYLIDENKNIEEGFTKEESLAVLQQAIADQSLENIDPDSAVASKLRSKLTGKSYNLEFVTTATYNALVEAGEVDPNTIYYLTDDNSMKSFEEAIANINTRLDNLGFKSGVVTISSGSGTIVSQSLIKQGKVALFNIEYTGVIAEFQLPNGFYPKEDTELLFVRESSTSTFIYERGSGGGAEEDGGTNTSIASNAAAGADAGKKIAKTTGKITSNGGSSITSFVLTTLVRNPNFYATQEDYHIGHSYISGGWIIADEQGED